MYTSRLRLIAVALIASFLVSCSKEVIVDPTMNGQEPTSGGNTGTPGNSGNSGSGNSPIAGTYKIVYLYQKGQSQTTVKIGGETDMSINDFIFTGSEFIGTYVIDDKNFNYTNIGYTVKGPITIKSYTNGISDGDPFTMDFNQVLPPYSATGPYTIKGDSIYTAPVSGASPTGAPMNTSGLSDIYAQHYKFSGDTLIIDGIINITNRATSVEGYAATSSGTNYIIVKLLKTK